MADQALACLEIMQFEGIEGVRSKIAENGTMYQTLEQIIPLLMAMAQELDMIKGTQYTAQVAQMLGGQMPDMSAPSGEAGAEPEVNPLGSNMGNAMGHTVGSARRRVASSTVPQS